MVKPKHPTLFLLKSNFTDPKAGSGTFYCPYCIRIEGLLSVFPILRQTLQIVYVEFAKPRGMLPDFAGSEDQSCPQLVFPEGDDDFSHQWSVAGVGATRRIEDTQHIEAYLSTRFNLPTRHP